MSLPNREKEFAINEIGAVTKERYTGTFQVKRVLTQREEFLADHRRRSILGPNPENSSMAMAQNAYALGQLSVRIVKAPTWWNPNSEDVGGLDLLDENLIAKVFEETLKAEQEWRDEIAKKAEASVKTVEEAAEKKNPVIPDGQSGKPA